MLAHEPFRSIAARFQLSATSLIRHHDAHLSAALAQSVKAFEIARADDLVDRLIAVARETRSILVDARNRGDDEMALKAIARVEKQIELQAKLLGQLRDAPVVNITLSAEWLSIQTVIITALDPYPVARLAVADALARAGRQEIARA